MNRKICQSCGMPLKEDIDLGTNADGSKNNQYCHYCFQGGQFTDPNITLREQIEKVANISVSKFGTPKEEALKEAGNTLPNLSRWQDQEYKKSRSKYTTMMLVLVGLVVLGVGVTIYFNKKSGGGDSDRNFSTMIPIWIAVFVPFMASKKKQKTLNSKQKKLMTFVILGIVLALLLVTFFLARGQGEVPMIALGIGTFIILVLLIVMLRKKQS